MEGSLLSEKGVTNEETASKVHCCLETEIGFFETRLSSRVASRGEQNAPFSWCLRHQSIVIPRSQL